jgi:hypothetical protein
MMKKPRADPARGFFVSPRDTDSTRFWCRAELQSSRRGAETQRRELRERNGEDGLLRSSLCFFSLFLRLRASA